MSLHNFIKDYKENSSTSVVTSPNANPHTFTVASSLYEFLQGSWFEVSCALLLVLVSLMRMVRRASSQGPRPAKLAKCFAKETEDDKQNRKQIYNLFEKANRGHSATFDLYEHLVKQKSVNFRDYIRDDHHAQALFIALLTHAINSKKGSLVEPLMADMQQMGIPRNLWFYASVMKVYAARGQNQGALYMYNFMVNDKLKPDSTMYVCLMNNASTCNNSAMTQHFFSELCKVETPSLRTYMTILRTYQRENKWEAAVNILVEMKGAGIAPDNLVLNNVLGVCVSAGQVDTAAKLVENWKDTPDMVDVVSYNTVLKGYTKQSNFEKAEALLMRMQKDAKVPPNVISFNTVMDCAIRSMQQVCNRSKKHQKHNPRYQGETGDFRASCPNLLAIARKPWEILDRMNESGVIADKVTCSTLIKGMHLGGCSVQEIDRAIALLKIVGPEAVCAKDNENSRLHEVLFNSMLDACVNARDLNRMAEVFAIMRDCYVPVSAVTFGTLIKAFGQAGNTDRVREVWAEMRVAKVRPTAVTYGCCIDACMRNGDIDTAMKTFEEMKPDGCVPNSVIYASLIRGFGRSKQPERVLALYKEMRRNGIECSSAIFNMVLDAVARNTSEPTELARVLDDMRASDSRPDVVTYSVLIKACCAAWNLENAMFLFERMKQEGLVLDEITFNSLLSGCSRNNNVEYAETVFASMRVNVKPSNVTFSTLVKMYGKAKMLDKATEVLDLMENEYKVKPNAFFYTCLIQACVDSKQVQRAWDYFHSMQVKGVEPDGVTYGTLIQGCMYSNKFDLAMTLVKQAKTVNTVKLQPEILDALRTSLNRKGRAHEAAEVESLKHTNSSAYRQPRPHTVRA